MCALPSVIEAYLKGVRSLLRTDVDRSRALLSKLIGPVVLKPEGDGLVAEVTGSLRGILPMSVVLVPGTDSTLAEQP